VRSFADSAVIPPAVLEILSSFSPCPAVAGELRFIVSELEVSALPGTRLIVYTPEDGATRARLPSICSPPDGGGELFRPDGSGDRRRIRVAREGGRGRQPRTYPGRQPRKQLWR
jgi:hypothetical protein